MKNLPIVFCDACAEQLGQGKPITVRTDHDTDHPGAACCAHMLAEYRKFDGRQSDIFDLATARSTPGRRFHRDELEGEPDKDVAIFKQYASGAGHIDRVQGQMRVSFYGRRVRQADVVTMQEARRTLRAMAADA